MFVIQRVLEVEGKLTLLDQNKVISPHSGFRLFATANTVGLGDTSGLYHGTQQINQGQMDRWHIVSTLNYLDPELELKVVLSKVQSLDKKEGVEIAKNMISVANLSRQGFANGDISTLMSPRTVISWAQLITVRGDMRVEISPLAKPCLDKFATEIIFLAISTPSFLSKLCTLESTTFNSSSGSR